MSAGKTETFPVIDYQTRQIVYIAKENIFTENISINYDIVETTKSDEKLGRYTLSWFDIINNMTKPFTLTYQPLIYINKITNSPAKKYMESTHILLLNSYNYDVKPLDYEDGLLLFGYSTKSYNNLGEIENTNLYSKGAISSETQSMTNILDHLIDEQPDYILRKFFYVTCDMWQKVCKPLFFKEIFSEPNKEKRPSNYIEDDDDESSELMGYSIGPKQLKNILKNYKNKGVETIPDIDFMHDVGTKEYVRHMKHFMLPDTFVYPDDKDILEKSLIPDLIYVVKSGMTSSGKGVKKVIGSEVIKTIEFYAAYSFKYRSIHKPIGIVEDESLGKSEIYSISDEVFDKYNEVENDCTSRIFIIQPSNRLYDHCYEYRFFVLRDKIIGVADPRGEFVYKDYKSGTIMNKDIYDYIHKVISHVSERYNNYLFMRVDIIIDCGYLQREKPKKDFLSGNIISYIPLPENIDILFSNDDLKDKIWLNEIEPLGSGHKARGPITLYDTDKSAVVFHGKKYHDLSIGATIVETICYQTHRLINNMDNKDITICLLNINWLNRSYNGEISHVNLITYGTWTWDFVQELMNKQLYSTLGVISDIKFYALTKDTKTELPLSDTILDSLLNYGKKVIYGFEYK